MARGLIFALMVAAAVPPIAGAQSGVFTDSRSGISFRYPPTWQIAATQPFMLPILDSEPDAMPHIVVFTHRIPGISHWPTTEFAGAAFAYDARPAASPEACRAMGLPADKRAAAKEDAILHGVRYWHSTAEDGGMSKDLREEIYATFLPAPANRCFLFDFAVYSVLAPGDDPLRPLTLRESSRLRGTGRKFLASIRISAPSR